MIVKLVWPDCSLINDEYGELTIDSFWVEWGQYRGQVRLTAFREYKRQNGGQVSTSET